MTAAVARALDGDAIDSGAGAYIGRTGFELCRCADCISRRPVAVVDRPVRVFRAQRTKCPGCGVSRGLAGRLCWTCAPKGK